MVWSYFDNAYEHACLDEYFQCVDAITCFLDFFYACVFAMIRLLPWMNNIELVIMLRCMIRVCGVMNALMP